MPARRCAGRRRTNPPLPPEQREALKTPLHDALIETAPFLRECCKKAAYPGGTRRIHVRGKLVLTGDRDIGTLVDADQLTDEHDQPLPAALDDCLRGVMQTLELPPLREATPCMSRTSSLMTSSCTIPRNRRRGSCSRASVDRQVGTRARILLA